MISLIVNKKKTKRKNSGLKNCDLKLFVRLSLSLKILFDCWIYNLYIYHFFHLYTMCETNKPDC